jgi:predicted RNA-binding Zn ribbon-like protein
MSENLKSFGFIAGAHCLDFVNTVGARASEYPNDKLATYADLVRWSEQAGLIDEGKALELLSYAEANSSRTAKVLEEARGFRETLFRIFGALQRMQPPPPSDLAALNRALQRYPIRLKIRPRGRDFFCTREVGQAIDAWPLAPVAWSAAELLSSDQMHHVHKCADATCGWLFVDTTKNHSRRWCAMDDCGSLAKARRYYQRKRKTSLRE